jgi:hypothetical protein
MFNDDLGRRVRFVPKCDRRQHPKDRRVQWRGGRRTTDFDASMRELAARIIGEYAEHPGLKLTMEQATRLFDTDVKTCAWTMVMLTRHGVVTRTTSGHFVMLRDPRDHYVSTQSIGREGSRIRPQAAG